jgi:hypothetical protein
LILLRTVHILSRAFTETIKEGPVRVTLRKFPSGFLLALLTAVLFLAPGGRTYAQIASRSLQMALWTDPGQSTLTSADTDISMFNEGQPQPIPPARTFMRIGLTGPTFAADSYDWSRIVAVLVDEPYGAIDSEDNYGNPCEEGGAKLDAVNGIEQQLAARATELKSVAPLVRFWVNFTGAELGWMMESDCPLALNQPYIDVISLDVYYTPFSTGVKYNYDWLAANPAKPDQQLALIPGTFYRIGIDSPSTQASYLQGYFDYANNANQSCTLSLGSRGVTGSFDGCPVWIVLGWLSGEYTNGNTQYVGELDSRSAPIAAAWRQEVALPLRADLAQKLTRGGQIQEILRLLLNN